MSQNCHTYDSLRKPGKTLAIIPARGGSKGIRNKNIRDLCGAPLIAYSIAAALQTPSISRVIVSTDDKDIAETALHWGAEVPYLRPAHLATDSADLNMVVADLINSLRRDDGDSVNRVCVMLPTQPFRTVRTLNYLCEQLASGQGSIVTGTPIPVGKTTFMVPNHKGGMTPLMDAGAPYHMYSDSQNYFKSSGYFYGRNWGHEYENPCVHHLDNPVERHDIDDPVDLDMACRIIHTGLFQPDWELSAVHGNHSNNATALAID